jgi:hypothetical protein
VLDAIRAFFKRPTSWIALVLVITAVAGVVEYDNHHLHAWMPNVVVGAVTVAATITIVDGAVLAERKRRSRPRLEAAASGISGPFKGLLIGVAWDYGQTHATIEALPGEPVGLLDLWLREASTENRERPVKYEGLTFLIATFATRLSEVSSRYRILDEDVLEDGFKGAIDRFVEAAENAESAQDLVLRGLPNPQKALAETFQLVVERAKPLALELDRALDGWSPVDLWVHSAADAGNDSR